MKKALLFIFLLLSVFTWAQVNICANFYAVTGQTAYVCAPAVPGSSTLVPILIPTGAAGMALGPSFGFLAPNPTLWTVIGGNYWYFNGSTFVNSNHTAGGLGMVNPGASANYIYNINPFGVISKYDGTGNATQLTTIAGGPGLVTDIVGDDLDNFYIMRVGVSPQVSIYNSSGVLNCTYAATGVTLAPGPGPNAFAVVDNTICVETNSGIFVGILSGSVVNFSTTSFGFTNASDFANCYRSTIFNASISASPSSSITCLTPTINLIVSVNPTLSVSGYSWSGVGIVGAANTPTIQVNLPGIYTCTVTSCEGATTVANFTVNNSPIITSVLAGVSKNTICVGDTATLFASGAGSYTWLPGGLTGSAVVVNPLTTTNYTVTGVNSIGCSSMDTISVYVTQGPTLTAASNPTSLCFGGSTTLSATGATNYTWFPGNLQGAIVVANPGSTTVYSVLSSAGSCTAMATTTVLNPTSPQITSSGNTLTCNNATAQVIVIPGSVNDSISWAGPGIIPPVNSVSLNLTQAGTYTVIVTNTLANCVSIDSIKVISQLAPISLSIVPSSTLICNPGGTAVNLLVSTPAFCTWQPTIDISPPTGPYVSVNPTVSTTYTVTGVLGACTGTASIGIQVNASPTIAVVASSYSICSSKNCTLTASGASNYVWMPGSVSGNSITVSPGQSITYTVFGETANCYDSDTIRINVLPSPALLPYASPVVICAGGSSTLTALNATTYTWQALPLTSASVAVSPLVTTNYTVVGTNQQGCTSQSVTTVYVNQPPPLNSVTSASVICRGDSVILNASGAPDFTWVPGNLNGSQITVGPTVSTIYTVSASNASCTASMTLEVNVNSCEAPPFGVTNAASNPVAESQDMFRIDFTVTVTNPSELDYANLSLINDLKNTFIAPASFTILNPPLITSKNSSLTVNPFYDGNAETDLLKPASSQLYSGKRDTLVFAVLLEPKGFYGQAENFTIGKAEFIPGQMVVDTSNNGFLWDPDGDGNAGNNNDVTRIDIEYINLFIPEGFTPNGDDHYDRFEIKGIYGRPVKLTVFNRWGNKVYEKSNYDNSWDGRANVGATIGNGKLPPSTYYYILQFLDGKKESKNGFVVLDY